VKRLRAAAKQVRLAKKSIRRNITNTNGQVSGARATNKKSGKVLTSEKEIQKLRMKYGKEFYNNKNPVNDRKTQQFGNARNCSGNEDC